MPPGVKVVIVHNSEPKEVRAEWLLGQYQLRPPGVVHARKLVRCEERMVSFPKGQYDDIVDAVGTGVRRFLGPKKKAGIRTSSYAA
jgi:phage terminase large subunit-like protein